jgi:CheY-like chemotaxis protein
MKVLLTEDVEVARRVACLVLNSLGCVIDVALNGQAALDAMAVDSNYDLILMDLGLPDIPGEEVAQRIQAQYGDQSKMKVVALTAHAPLDDMSMFDAIIEKPLTKHNFCKLLKKIDLYDCLAEAT